MIGYFRQNGHLIYCQTVAQIGQDLIVEDVTDYTKKYTIKVSAFISQNPAEA